MMKPWLLSGKGNPTGKVNIIIPNAINGIDVSWNQRHLDARKVAAAGFKFAYVQSSKYSKGKDPSFGDLVGKLRDAGLRVGAYHFCSHDTDPRAQADHFAEASGLLGSKPGELPPMVDWEFCTPTKYPNHPNHCVTWAENFCQQVKFNWYGVDDKRLPCIYTYPVYGLNHQPALKGSVLGVYPLAYASYPGRKEYVPDDISELPFHPVLQPWAEATLCQYSGNNGATVPGIGTCDRQAYLGKDFDSFCGLNL